MQQLKPVSPPQRRQRGVSLLESLVAIAVAALGILGVVGVQMRTLADTQTTVRRAQAVRLIEDLSERLKVNPNAMDGLDAYVSGFNDEPTPGDCSGSNSCTKEQLAAHDIGVWKQTVKSNLPLGQANVFVAPAESGVSASNRRQLGVMISWRENEKETDTDYKDSIDATKVKNGSTLTAGGGSVTCPTDRVCHLQYIPVSARCAPDLGSGIVQFYCS